MKKKAIILDRDGTIIVDKIYLNDPEQIEYLPGVFDALRIFRDLGYVFAVATNQSGVPRGLVDVKNLDEIHRRIGAMCTQHEVEILSFHSAPYMTDSNHHLRKPNTGMLEEAAELHNIDLSQSWMIGDKMTDVEAGRRAGCKTVLLGDGDDPKTSEFAPPTLHVNTLLEAAEKIRQSSVSS